MPCPVVMVVMFLLTVSGSLLMVSSLLETIAVKMVALACAVQMEHCGLPGMMVLAAVVLAAIGIKKVPSDDDGLERTCCNIKVLYEKIRCISASGRDADVCFYVCGSAGTAC